MPPPPSIHTPVRLPPQTCVDCLVDVLSWPLEKTFAWTVPDCTDPDYEKYAREHTHTHTRGASLPPAARS